MVSGRMYPKAMLSMSKDVSSRLLLVFKKAIPIPDSEAVLKIAFPLPRFSSSLFHVIAHLGKQITAFTASCVPLTSAKAAGSPGENLLKPPL